MKIVDFYNFKFLLERLDKFWQKFESKLDVMIKLLVYVEVFDCVVEKDVIFLFGKVLGYCCIVEFNLFLVSDVKVIEVLYNEIVRLLQDRLLGKRKDFCRIFL